jgi:DNA polymerase-3 subunit epsilon
MQTLIVGSQPHSNIHFLIDAAMVFKTANEWLEDPDGIILDTETTGLEDEDEIVQISVLDMDGNILLNQYMQPMFKEMHPEAFAVNGIAPEMLIDCPTWPEVWPEIEAVLAGKNMIAHSAAFDERMIVNSNKRCGLPAPPWKSVRCTNKLVLPIYGQPGDTRVSLVNACAATGVQGGGKHEGVGDALDVLSLLHGLSRKIVRPEPAREVVRLEMRG